MKSIFAILAMVAAITMSWSVPITAEEPQQLPAAGTTTGPKLGDEVHCAVYGMKMRLEADTPSLEYQGKMYYFCADAEKQAFLKHPERYTNH